MQVFHIPRIVRRHIQHCIKVIFFQPVPQCMAVASDKRCVFRLMGIVAAVEDLYLFPSAREILRGVSACKDRTACYQNFHVFPSFQSITFIKTHCGRNSVTAVEFSPARI